MEQDLATYLGSLQPVGSEQVVWRGGQIHLDLTCYRTAFDPPDHLITSARCIIVARDQVLVLSNPDGEHILPGGRRDPGETPAETAVREVKEETGLDITVDAHCMVMHFHHTTPEPPLYEYPYPDFLQIVYLVYLEEPIAISVSDTYELDGTFVPFTELADRIPASQWAMLQQVMSEERAISG